MSAAPSAKEEQVLVKVVAAVEVLLFGFDEFAFWMLFEGEDDLTPLRAKPVEAFRAEGAEVEYVFFFVATTAEAAVEVDFAVVVSGCWVFVLPMT